MKKILTFLIFSFPFTILLSQKVGINTHSPQGFFHIDPLSDTSGGTGVSDDFIVINNNNRVAVSVGNVSPTASLHIDGTLRIADGTESDEYVLTSDNTGKASWQRKILSSVIEGPDPDAAFSSTRLNGTSQYTGVYITVPAGTWQINFTCSYLNPAGNKYGINIWWDLATSPTIYPPARVGRILSNHAGPGTESYVIATYSVTTAVETTYYVWGLANINASQGDQPLDYSGLGRIWAIPAR